MNSINIDAKFFLESQTFKIELQKFESAEVDRERGMECTTMCVAYCYHEYWI